MPQPLPVVLLWHMHQPQYRDALTGQYVLPWTYLHAIKDYTDMAAHLEEHAGARAVVNFTPVLLEQLEEIARRIAEHLRAGSPLPDPLLALLGPDPVPTDPVERLELLTACLRANRQRLVDPFVPFAELVNIADSLASPSRIIYASDELMHDLAVWYHLAWMGETVRRSEPLIGTLIEQGRRFTPDQRHELLGLVGRLVSGITPRYRRLAQRGQVELSMTPYGHPIVPLLLDFQSGRDALPEMALPAHDGYAGGAERAAWHVEEGIRLFTQVFGIRPQGCWPSEGAISRATLELLDRSGFHWAATGGGVLTGSLWRSDPRLAQDPLSYNRPYRVPGTRLRCFFRDDTLSDLIGFTYANWHGDDAANNLVHELEQLATRYSGPTQHAVLIALDGENAWEHYPFNGYYFLNALYERLSANPRLELTTVSDCLARGIEPAPLPVVMAGSWVHGTLATWMGDPAKNRAWDLLCDAKRAFDGVMQGATLDSSGRLAASRQLALCESSDWFWWFGDYNPADAVSQFDRLYRRQLVNLYRLLRLAPPEGLSRPISVGSGSPEGGGVMRRAQAG